MSEYWVSKKQYWCKYCNIWIRDDAPSRSLHESGLKHQGNKERYIRDIYRSGERSKREKEANAREFARIEAAAAAAHAKDTGVYAGRPAPDARPVASSSVQRPRPKAFGDKLANYSTAAQLGFDDEETKLSSYEIEQMVRGRATSVGKWETVTERPNIVYGEDGVPSTAAPPQPEVQDEDDHENFKFSHRDKRPVRDVYDDDDWDVGALGDIKLKTKERRIGEVAEDQKGKGKAGFKKIGDGVKEESDQVKDEVKNEVKDEVKDEPKDEANGAPEADAAKTASPAAEVKTETGIKTETGVKTETEPAPAPTASMFKKRRPPPSSRKK